MSDTFYVGKCPRIWIQSAGKSNSTIWQRTTKTVSKYEHFFADISYDWAFYIIAVFHTVSNFFELIL